MGKGLIPLFREFKNLNEKLGIFPPKEYEKDFEISLCRSRIFLINFIIRFYY